MEDRKGAPVRPHNTPAEPKGMLSRHQGEPVDHKLYQTVVGKLMYYTQKIMIKGINATRELSKHLQNPGPEHWDAVKYMTRFLKKEQGQIHITYQTPRELQFVAMVNTNFATNVEDQKSISGAIYTLGGAIIGWFSKT